MGGACRRKTYACVCTVCLRVDTDTGLSAVFVDGGRSIEDGVRQRADGGALLAFRLLADPADLCPSPSGELLLRQIRGLVLHLLASARNGSCAYLPTGRSCCR